MVVDGGCWILAKIQRTLLHSVSVRSHPETMFASGDQLREVEGLSAVVDRKTEGWQGEESASHIL